MESKYVKSDIRVYVCRIKLIMLNDNDERFASDINNQLIIH